MSIYLPFIFQIYMLGLKYVGKMSINIKVLKLLVLSYQHNTAPWNVLLLFRHYVLLKY